MLKHMGKSRVTGNFIYSTDFDPNLPGKNRGVRPSKEDNPKAVRELKAMNSIKQTPKYLPGLPFGLLLR
jgi:hypothetical protein